MKRTACFAAIAVQADLVIRIVKRGVLEVAPGVVTPLAAGEAARYLLAHRPPST